jgi:hypothetical protein
MVKKKNIVVPKRIRNKRISLEGKGNGEYMPLEGRSSYINILFLLLFFKGEEIFFEKPSRNFGQNVNTSKFETNFFFHNHSYKI